MDFVIAVSNSHYDTSAFAQDVNNLDLSTCYQHSGTPTPGIEIEAQCDASVSNMMVQFMYIYTNNANMQLVLCEVEVYEQSGKQLY